MIELRGSRTGISRRGALIAVGALTAGAFLLRLHWFGETLFGDELFAYDQVHGRALTAVLKQVTQGDENSPPLYFVLAWGSIKLGDPTTLIRLPSLLLGTACVPVVYLLGARLFDRAAGLVAATLTALSPLAVYFSSEARPYATLMFLAALSTLALLLALERGRWWWALFVGASLAALYTHYTAIPVIAVQGAWALWAERRRAREVLRAYLAIAAGCLVWVPVVLAKGGFGSLSFIKGVYPLTPASVARFTVQLVPGYQRMPLAEVPGRPASWLFVIAVAVAVLGVAATWLRRSSGRPQWESRNLVLALALALATPCAVLAYSLLGSHIYTARHLVASFPAVVVLLAALFTRLPRPLAAAATLMAFASLSIGLVRALEPDRGKPPLKPAARFVDSRAAPTDPVVDFVFLARTGLFTQHLEINFKRPHRVYQTGFVPPADPDFWTRIAGARRLFVVKAYGGKREPSPLPAALGGRFRLTDRRIWRGRPRVEVLEYSSKSSP